VIIEVTKGGFVTIVQLAAGHVDGEAVDELFIDRRFIVSYKTLGLTPSQEERVKGMISSAVEEGKRIRSREFKALVG